MNDDIELKSLGQQLLNKIELILCSIKQKLKKSTCDLDILFHLSNRVLLKQCRSVLESELSFEAKKTEVKTLLSQRWQDIKNTGETYCENPRDPLNQLCWSLALYVSPLPENLSECDNWQVGQGPYFVLMPDLEACEDIVNGTNIHQYRLHEFILSEDNKRFIPIHDTLNYFFEGSSKKPLHMVFTEEQMANIAIDKSNDLLTDLECVELKQHSELTQQIMQCMAILKNPDGNFFNRLSKFADGLFAGSSHGGVGQGDNAASQANEAIVEFFDYWDGLPNEIRQFYLNKVPQLGPILKRISDPVSISRQGVNYCVGLTGGDLRHIVSQNKSVLQGADLSRLNSGVKTLLLQLDSAIKKTNYPLATSNKNSLPLPSKIMELSIKEQQSLIKDYLNLDYPNFLYYVFEHQPLLVDSAIAAFNRSKFKIEIFKQRSYNNSSLLMTVAQLYPEKLDKLLPACLDFDDEVWHDEFSLRALAGDSLVLMILRRRPEVLGHLFSIIERLDKKSQLHLLQQGDKQQGSMLMMLLQNNIDAFIQFAKKLIDFNSKTISKLLALENLMGDTLLLLGFRDHASALPVLMPLLDKCGAKDLKRLVFHENRVGLNVARLSLTLPPEYFQMVVSVFNQFDSETIGQLFLSNKDLSECLLLKAVYAPLDNFKQVLSLLADKLDDYPDRVFNLLNKNNEHLLLAAMQQQPVPSTLLFEQLKSLPKQDLYLLLTQQNNEGFTVLTLALSRAPQYYLLILEVILTLAPNAQKIIFNQVGINGEQLPLLAALHAPQHLLSILECVSQTVIESAFNQTNIAKHGLLPLTMTSNLENFLAVIDKFKSLPLSLRFNALSQADNQGNNVVAYFLQQKYVPIDNFFDLIESLTSEQQQTLLTHRNVIGMHALTLAYQYYPKRLEEILTRINNDVLKTLPITSWFDLFSLSSSHSLDFQSIYEIFKKLHKNNKIAWVQLFTCLDTQENNLLMIIIQTNPDFSRILLRDVKEYLAEKSQRQLLLQSNYQLKNVMSLAEKYMPDDFIVNLQALLKRVDKNHTKKMIAKASIKMHSAEVLISSETLEQCNATQLMAKLSKEDSEGDHLLGQMVLRMPYRLPALIKKMQKLLSSNEIKQLLQHNNNQGYPLYLLALMQPQASFLCNYLHPLFENFSFEVRMDMLALPEGESSLIDMALKNSPLAFMTTMHWLGTFDKGSQEKLLKDFWLIPAVQFERAVELCQVDICRSLIVSTQNFPDNELVTLLLSQISIISKGLCSENMAIRDLFLQWLAQLEKSRQVEVLLHLSIGSILTMLNQEKMSLLDLLPIKDQAVVLNCRDDFGHSVFHHAFINRHSCLDKLSTRLNQLPPSQLAIVLSQTDGKSSLLHSIAIQKPTLLSICFENLKDLPSQTLVELFLCRDEQNNTVLDLLLKAPALYQKLLKMYQSFSLNEQILLLSQLSGAQNLNLLQRVPSKFKHELWLQLEQFPQSVQIELFVSMSKQAGNGLKIFMQDNLFFCDQIFCLIETFPVNIKGALYLESVETDSDLLFWMLTSENNELRLKNMEVMSGLSKRDLGTFLMKKRQRKGGDHVLQFLAKKTQTLSNQTIFNKAFELFMRLPTAVKMQVLSQENQNNKNLFADLILHKRYKSFERLCHSMSEFSDLEKIQVLYGSGFVPTNPTTLWVSTFYGSPINRHFLELLANKAFCAPMLHLLQTLPPKTQINILSNRMPNGRILLDEIGAYEKPQLKFMLKQAEAMLCARDLLKQMADTIADEDINSPKATLHRMLCDKLDAYQNTYEKGYQHVHELAQGWQQSIEAYMPHLQQENLSCLNILVGLLRLVVALLMPIYGAYLIHEKVSTNRNVLFKTNNQSIVYDLQDTIMKIEKSGEKQLDLTLPCAC